MAKKTRLHSWAAGVVATVKSALSTGQSALEPPAPPVESVGASPDNLRQQEPPLHLGAEGARVGELQMRLAQLGFPPGRVDQKFGPGTEAAVRNFQASVHLPSTGIVDEVTHRRLHEYEPPDPSFILGMFTPELVKRMFPQTPIENIRANLPLILSELAKQGLADREMILVALATVRAETESFLPIAEYVSRYNTSPNGRPFDLYDNRKDLGNRGNPDGWNYRGRSSVQLTGRYNYKHYGQLIGLGDRLEQNPDLACDPEISAKLLAAFIKSKEPQIRTALQDNSLKTVRRLINGGSHGLARFVETYNAGLRLTAEPMLAGLQKNKPLTTI